LIDATDRLVYVLDTGNSRVVAVDDGGTVVREVTGEALGGTAVGMALLGGTLPELVTLNWRDRVLTKWSSGGLPVQSVSFSELVEPTDVVVDSRGRIILLDNGAGKVFVFDAGFRPLFNFVVPSMSSLTCLAVGLNDDLLIGTSGGGLLLFDGGGRFLRTISTAPNGSKDSQRVAACAVDRVSGLVVFSSDGRGATLGVSHYKGSFAFPIRGARLHRPSGLCIGLGDRSNLCYVTDLHTHSIRSFRFK